MQSTRTALSNLPWMQTPHIVCAPMRVLSGPKLAVAVSEAQGIGFLGPGAKPTDMEKDLKEAKELCYESAPLRKVLESGTLPIGTGFQTWAGDLTIASSLIKAYKPAAAWLFAPRHGQTEIDDWVKGLREASNQTQIWVQVASVKDAVATVCSQHVPDVLVIQGSDAGGHSLLKGAGIMTLLPEVADMLRDFHPELKIPLVAAGGISDGRGLAAALVAGASAVAMGTRFLASREARINPEYQQHIIDASDGGQATVRTQLYNHLRGTTNWPKPFDARGLINQSWRDHETGMSFEQNKALHDETLKIGGNRWGSSGRVATYAGTGIGLIKRVESANDLVIGARHEAAVQLESTMRFLGSHG